MKNYERVSIVHFTMDILPRCKNNFLHQHHHHHRFLWFHCRTIDSLNLTHHNNENICYFCRSNASSKSSLSAACLFGTTQAKFPISSLHLVFCLLCLPGLPFYNSNFPPILCSAHTGPWKELYWGNEPSQSG